MRPLSQYINEQLSTLISQRMDITVQRLAYLRFAMEDNDKDKGLKEMYNTLYNLVFAKDGHTRSNQELLDYIKKTMEDNLGSIPGLPSNDAIENIDKKIVALDELDSNKLQHYMKEVEKEISDSKSKASKEDSKTSFDKDISDKELMKKISELIDTEGLSNILGLESDRKMSKDDKTKLKQKEDPIGSEDPSEEDKPKEENKEKETSDREEGDGELTEDEINQLKELSKEELDEFLKDFTEEEKQQILDLIKESLYSNNTIFEKKTRVPLSLKLAMKVRKHIKRGVKKVTGHKSNTTWRDRESVVKDKDGSEIHARQKKNSEGTTYVRMKGGKEIGYATKDEFLKAKKNHK